MPGRLFFDLLAQMSRVLAHGGMYLCVINDVNKGNTIGFAVTAGPIFIMPYRPIFGLFCLLLDKTLMLHLCMQYVAETWVSVTETPKKADFEMLK